MSDQNNNQGFVSDFFGSMPSWIKGIVFLLCAVPVALAISGTLLQVNVGSKIDKYFEVQMARQASATDAAADRIIEAFDDRLAGIESSVDEMRVALEDAAVRDHALNRRVDALEERIKGVEDTTAEGVAWMGRIDAWICGPVMRDGDIGNDPDWC